MLKSVRDDRRSEGAFQSTDSVEINFAKLLGIARRRFVVVALTSALGLGLGLVYALTAVPLYTARAQIMVDDRLVQPASEVAGRPLTNEAVDSEVAVIRSEKIGMQIVEQFSLQDDPDFMNPITGNFFTEIGERLLQYIDPRGWIGSGEGSVLSEDADMRERLLQYIDPRAWIDSGEETVLSEHAKKLRALRKLQSNYEVGRLKGTYIVEVSYTSSNRDEAARLANAVANAYLDDQLSTRYEKIKTAGEWLQQRTTELQRQARESDLAIQRFRNENNLIAADGRLISDQQLSEISSQLVLARAETARNRARYERINKITEAGDTNAIVGDAQQHPVFTTLRADYLSATKRADELSEKLGAEHIQVVQLRREVRQYERLIFAEQRRIAESYLSDFEVALSREESLQRDLDEALGVTAAANETLVTLRELESQAATYRSILDGFRMRFAEETQQQSFPITSARIITPATAPESPSYPRKSIALVLSMMLGGALGLGIGLMREYSDRAFRTGQQVRDELKLEFLGVLPRIGGLRYRIGHRRAVAAIPENAFAVPGTIFRYALDNPRSRFAETLWRAKVAMDTAKNGGIIGVVSTLAGEGKSTVATNLAVTLAQQGKRTLLVDADMRTRGLTRHLAPLAERGLVDNLESGLPLRDLLLTEVDCGLDFLPCVIKSPISNTPDLIASPAMNSLLREAEEAYEYIIIDCPPLKPVVDVRAAAGLFDGIIYVIEWGVTPMAAVRNALAGEASVYDRCLGIVLNRVDEGRLATYDTEGYDDYYE